MRRTPLRLLLLALPLALLLPSAGTRGVVRPAAAAPDFVGIEAAIAAERKKAALLWLDLADDLAGMDLKSEAEKALARSVALEPDLPAREKVGERVRALAGSGVPSPKSDKRIEKARKDVAECYAKMAQVLAKEQQDSRYAEWLVAAANLDPSKARVGTLAAMAQAAPLLVRSLDDPFAGYVSLPKGWKPGTTWPLAVCLEAEGLKFKPRLERFTKERGTTPWIVLVPLTFSTGAHLAFDDYYPAYTQKLVTDHNGRRTEFDLEGLPHLLGAVERLFGAERKAALSAHGAAGDLALRLLLQGTVPLASAVLVTPRYDEKLLHGLSAVADGGPPVTLLAAGPDPATKAVHEALVAAGFTQVASREALGDVATGMVTEAWAALTAPAAR
jgi:hypothetical protein